METLTSYLMEYRYGALFVAALVEGPVASFVAGSLSATGHLNLWTAFAVLACKDLLLDTALYGVGRASRVPFFARQAQKIRIGTKLRERVLTSIEQGWRDSPVQLMWVGKLAYGLSAWFMVSAGAAKLPLLKFVAYSVPVMVFQYGVLMTLGYSLSGLSQQASSLVLWIQVVAAAVAVFFIMRWFAHYIRSTYVR